MDQRLAGMLLRLRQAERHHALLRRPRPSEAEMTRTFPLRGPFRPFISIWTGEGPDGYLRSPHPHVLQVNFAGYIQVRLK